MLLFHGLAPLVLISDKSFLASLCSIIGGSPPGIHLYGILYHLSEQSRRGRIVLVVNPCVDTKKWDNVTYEIMTTAGTHLLLRLFPPITRLQITYFNSLLPKQTDEN